MIDVIPGRIMELIREAELMIQQEQEEKEARREAEMVKRKTEDERVKKVFLDALPEDIRIYADFGNEILTEDLLIRHDFLVVIKIPGLFPITACLYPHIGEAWRVHMYQVATWSFYDMCASFDVTIDEEDLGKALLIAKQKVDELKQHGYMESSSEVA